jgi:stearoyl-CoA 9-desaturase NADPH oxidoreductase
MFTIKHRPAMHLASPSSRRASPLRRFWRHPLWSPLNEPAAWSRLLTVLDPVRSLTECRARVVRVVDEAPGVRSLWLAPNRRFGRFAAGQHVLLQLDIDGARHARCFSLSLAPRRDGLLRLTIKRKDHGPVSTAAHALTVGDVVTLGRAQGRFAPREDASALLLLSAGSGITPMLALLHALADDGAAREVALLQCESTPEDALFGDELSQLAARWPSLRVIRHVTGDAGRLDAAAIADLVPDWSSRETLLCGPDGFMHTVEAMYAAAGCSRRLQSESFGRRAAPIDPTAAEHTVTPSVAGRAFTAKAGQTLLDAAEAAGLAPRFGCRRGICRTCQCKKTSGTVVNLLTGQTSGPGEELIQLCISTPQSAVEVVL